MGGVGLKGWEYRKIQEKAKRGWKPGIACPYKKVAGKPQICLIHWTEQDLANHPERCKGCPCKEGGKFQPHLINLDGIKLEKRDSSFAKHHYQGRKAIGGYVRPRRVA